LSFSGVKRPFLTESIWPEQSDISFQGIFGRLLTDAINIAVGSKSFVEKVKSLLGFKAKGRDVIEGGERYHLREEAAP